MTVQAFLLLFSVLTVVFFSVSNVSAQQGCNLIYGNWSTCQDGNQQRSVDCICNSRQTELSNCLGAPLRMKLDDTSRDCDTSESDEGGEEEVISCSWKWNRWSRCTAPCGGGNTTRIQVCICEDRSVPSSAEMCDDDEYYGNETAECNQYKCGSVPAFNKVYWMNQLPDWPINPQTRFNCSLGFDANSTDTPKGKTYANVLSDPRPETHPHFEWYYLAKEWIAATLNIANGVVLSPEGQGLVDDVALLLDNCREWPSDPSSKYVVYGDKEKLGRLNNNIGGLSNVDAQMAILAAEEGNGLISGEASDSQRDATLALVGIIPLVAALVIVVAIAVTVYYIKQKKNAVVEQAAFESEDEASTDEVNPHLSATGGGSTTLASTTTITTKAGGDTTVHLDASHAGGHERQSDDTSDEHQ